MVDSNLVDLNGFSLGSPKKPPRSKAALAARVLELEMAMDKAVKALKKHQEILERIDAAIKGAQKEATESD